AGPAPMMATWGVMVLRATMFLACRGSLVDVQLFEERERVVEGLEQVLVVLDHLAAHVDAKPLLVDVQLIAIEHVSERQGALRDESRPVHRTLESQRNRLKVRRADGRVAGEEHRRAGEGVVARACCKP